MFLKLQAWLGYGGAHVGYIQIVTIALIDFIQRYYSNTLRRR